MNTYRIPLAKINSSGRDSTKGRVYKAERAAMKRFAHGGYVYTKAEYAQALEDVTNSPTFVRLFPLAAATPIDVEFGRLGGANANSKRIRTGTGAWACNRWIMLHELAHTVQFREKLYRWYADSNGTLHQAREDARAASTPNFWPPYHSDGGHGPIYCEIYVTLIREFVGNAEADALVEELHERGCKVGMNDPYRRPRGAAPVHSRNSNPRVSAKVSVFMPEGDTVVYASVRAAYLALGFDLAGHQQFRLQLKRDGYNVYHAHGRHYVFQTIPKE